MKPKILQRVVLLNSADFQYANVEVAGNTCFAGTNGNGKTTLQRAFLFFYNANASRLGIDTSKKRFEEYYFPTPTSYIIYEVGNEETSYHILVYRPNNQMHLQYRFIDAPFDKDLYINPSTKEVFDFKEILQQLTNKNIYFSFKAIEGYETFRSIIFGNTGERRIDKRDIAAYRRFALVNANRNYNNICTAITNIFLSNTKDVKSDFVKDFIADALSADNNKIDLRQNKRNIAFLAKHYEDIRVFLEPKHLHLAEDIAAIFTEMKTSKVQQKEIAISLGKMLKYSENKIAAANEIISEYDQQMQQIDTQISLAMADFEEKSSVIREKIGVVKAKIEEVERRTKYYDAEEIESLLAEEMKIEHYEEQINLKEEEYKLFSRDFQDIENILAERERELNLREREIIAGFEQKQTALLNNRKQEEEEIKRQIQAETERLKAEVQEALDNLREVIKNCELEQTRLKGDSRMIGVTVPYHSEILQIEQELRDIKTALQAADATIRQNKQYLSHNEAQKQAIREKNALKQEQAIRETEREIAKNRQYIEEIQLKLDTFQHTLYGFLSENVPDWRDTIGKICREEILFSDKLSPVFSSEKADSFFGLQLDLSDIAPIAKTMEEYREEQNEAHREIERLKNELAATQDKYATEEQNALKPLYESSKALQAETHNVEAMQVSNTEKYAVFSAQLVELRNKSEAQKRLDIEANTKAQTSMEQKKQQAAQALKQGNDELNTKVTAVTDKEKTMIAAINDKYIVATNELDQQKDEILQDIDTQRDTIKEQTNRDLSAKGVDSHTLEAMQKEIDRLRKKILYVQEHKSMLLNYKRDKEEYFDKEEEFQSDLASLNAKNTALKNEFEVQKQELIEEKNGINNLKAKTLLNQQEYVTGIKYYQLNILTNAGLCQEFQTEIESQNAENTYQNIEEIAAKLLALYTKQKDDFFKFSNDVKKYANLFHEENILGFSNSFDSNADYNTFAEKLTDFLQEQKINEYIRSVNKGYALAVESITRDINNLTGQEDGVKRIISDVEKEFKNAQFGDTGLIESIEIRPIETENTILKKLKKAALYYEQHLAEKKEQTLFSVVNDEFVVEAKDAKMIKLLYDIKEAIDDEKDKKIIGVKDLFEIEFRIKEGSNDSGWVRNLKNIGSEGTDILVKAIINITLLHSFVKKAISSDQNFRLHCIIDEIGKISRPLMIQLIKFAADRNIYLINGLPNESGIETSYKYTYKLSKIGVRKIVTKQLQIEVEV